MSKAPGVGPARSSAAMKKPLPGLFHCEAVCARAQHLGPVGFIVSTCALAERADKPGSVVGRPFIFCLRCRRPHSRATRTQAGPTHGVPICPFSGWGLPSRAVTDALVRSYRTVSAFLARGKPPAGVFCSVALSVGSPRPAVSRHPALWSPDFPHRDAMASPARPSGPLRQEGSIYQREGQSPSRWYPQL